MCSKKNSSPKYSVINDAVHGVMSLPWDHNIKDLVKSLIDNPCLQRLRHIKQLGVASLIFPSAVHTRFNHSLGAAYIAWLICEKLELEEKLTQYAVVAALLHDIGHGPLSHGFEGLIINKKKEKINHEDWTSRFLEQDSIKGALEKYDLDCTIIESLIKGDDACKKNEYSVIADLISSPLDMDKLDYLLRDSHFCGVEYGNIDLEWLINNLVVIEPERGAPMRLGICYKGWHAAEHLLLCRRIMNQNVYLHPKKVMLESLIVSFLESLCNAFESNKKADKDIINEIYNKSLRKFLKNLSSFKKGELSKDEFLSQSFSYYKMLTDYDVWMLIRDFSDIDDRDKRFKAPYKIARRLYHRLLPKAFKFDHTKKKQVQKVIGKLFKDHLVSWEIFIADKELCFYKKNSELLVLNEQGQIKEISEISALLKSLKGKSEDETCLVVDLEMWDDSKKRKKIKKAFERYVSFPPEGK